MLPPYGLAAIATQWQLAPVVTGVVAAAALLYGWGVVRVARRHPARPWPWLRALAFGLGLAVLVVATQSGIGAYDDLLFYDHMIQHLLLLMVVPPLLIGGQPLTLLLHASRNPVHTWAKRLVRSRVASFLTWPVFGTLAYAAAVLAAHLTALATYIDQHELAHNLEHAGFVLVGYLFYLPILGSEPVRWRLSYPVRFIILVLLMPVDTFTGLALGYGSASSPGVPAGPRPAWAGGAVPDLHTGGAIMWVGGDGLMFVLMMVVFWMWSTDQRAGLNGRSLFERARQQNLQSMLASQQLTAAGAGEPAAAVAESRTTIDDDAHLDAYNAYLARLNHPPGS